MVLRGLDKVCQETVAVFPQLQYTVRHIPSQTMPAFEVPKDAPIVKALNRAYESVRGEPQPTGALTPVCFYGSDAGHLYRSLGMQGVVCGPGGKYNTMPGRSACAWEAVHSADYGPGQSVG
jgi:acetylornithine deacetylase